jgi:hypothetical protein
MAGGGEIPANAIHSYSDPDPDPVAAYGDNVGKSASGADNKSSEEWKNDLDWLYNLMEDIVELERDQKKLEEEYEDILNDQTKTSKDLYSLLV